MKIVVIGGTGLIGSKTVAILRQRGHEVVAASPNTGVNTITGEGLKEAMAGTQVVIDLANSLRWARRASAASVSTNGSAAQRQQPDLHRRYAQGFHPLSRAGPGRRTKEATMTIKLVALVLLCLMTGTAVAQEPKVTSLMSRISGESRQGSSDDHSRACARWVERYSPTQCTCVCLRAGGLRCDAAEGWTTGDTDTRTDLL